MSTSEVIVIPLSMSAQIRGRPNLIQKVISFARRRTVACITLGLALVLLLILSTGGTVVYTTVPKDGLSPPWYPSRKRFVCAFA